MADPPVRLPEWATAGVIVEPIAGRKASGWLTDGFDVPPAGEDNWLQNTVYEWLVNFAGGAARYDSPDVAIGGSVTSRALVVGETCIVDEHDLDQQPGTEKDTLSLPAQTVVSVDVDGERVLIATTTVNTVRAYDRDIGTLLQTYTQTGLAAANVRVVTDGTYVIAAYGNLIECWNRAGTSQWVFDWTAPVNDICTDGRYVYFAADDVGGNAAGALPIAGPAATVWTLAHNGANLEAADCDGTRAFFAGAAGLGGIHMQAADALTGVQIWGVILPNAVPDNGVIASDGHYVYVAARTDLTRRSLLTGALIDTEVFTTDVYGVAVDQSYVYAAIATGAGADDDFVFAMHKRNIIERIWGFKKTVGGTDHTPLCIASDGCRIYIGQNDNASGGTDLSSVYRGNRPGIWRRVDPQADFYMPYRQLLVPSEE